MSDILSLLQVRCATVDSCLVLKVGLVVSGSATQKLHVQRMKWWRSIDSSEVRARDKVSDCSDDAQQSTERKELEQDVLHGLEQHHTTVDVTCSGACLVALAS